MDNLWTQSDGWILMSLYAAAKRGQAELWEIIGAADVSSRTIPTKQELNSTFSKLLQYGVLEIEDEKLGIRSLHHESIEKIQRSKGGIYKSSYKGLQWLTKAELSQNSSDVVEMTEKQVTQAFEKYTEEVKSKK